MIPAISGTVGGQTVTLGGSIDPFANASASDGNSLGSAANSVSPIATISLLNNGNQTGGNGSLSLNGNTGTTLADNGNGKYTLSVNNPASATPDNVATITQALHNIAFIPSTNATTTLFVSMTDKYGEYSSDSTTTVTASGSGGSIDQSNSGATPSSDTTLSASGNGHQVVADASSFTGTLSLVHGDIDLNGLVNADSISFAKDMLTVYTGDSQQTFNITGGPSWNVEKTATGVSVYTNDDTSHPGGNIMPFHT